MLREDCYVLGRRELAPRTESGKKVLKKEIQIDSSSIVSLHEDTLVHASERRLTALARHLLLG